MADDSVLGGAGSGAIAGAGAGAAFGPWGALIGAGIGAGIGAFGAYEGGEAEKQMQNYKAAVALMNQQIAQQNANYALYSGEVQAQLSGMQTRQQVGQIRAQQGASGLDVGSGSAVAVRQSQEEVGEENMALIRSDAAKRAYGFQVEAAQASAQGKLDTMAGAQAETAGEIAAAGSLVGGASSVSSKWVQFKQSGAIT